MAQPGRPNSPAGPKGYRVNINDVTVRLWNKTWHADTKTPIYSDYVAPTKERLAAWLFEFSGGLTWANGLAAHLDLSRRLAACEGGDILLSDAEYTTLKRCIERVPANSQADCIIVEQVMAAEEVPLEPKS